MKIVYNKLVCDRIPEMTTKDGKTYQICSLDETAYRKTLKQKLIEEVNELKDVPSKEAMILERADVLEVLEALQKSYGLDLNEILSTKRQNRTENLKRRSFWNM
ncbi:nucleoside triphosphate pyrophosphohydrolase [uncultured Dubosiella sp.]|uniref:nucleoside triphosphate pyrophosphohydrolase n=1 Tax=uncultured Dubosiella sp. TaxID=1937011 RepID=UPI002730CB96|nr:nucleoside triphosphate pyrophosphohydrolase [uncultured Dubosiella sp.]